MPEPDLPLKHLFVLLFMMTGPLKAVPTFAALTTHLDRPEKARIAKKAVLLAIVALFLAVFSGHSIITTWGASPQAVSAAAGLLLAIASLQAILGTAPASPATESRERDVAMSPLAFPTLVPPYAVGVLILFTTHFTETSDLVQMIGLATGMMLLNWVAMTYAHQILRVLGPATLRVLGSVFGVLQLSLGIEMIFFAFRTGFSPL